MPDRADRVFIDERYLYVDALGEGGMARVLLAHDTVLDRSVAIKVLREPYAGDPEFVERFRNEAQSAAALSHPNIVSIYDLGRSADETYYIAMEHVEGGTLKERLEREVKIDTAEAAALGMQISDALQAAHLKGVIHRDIKPQNVLLTETGEVRVADFGIARAASAASGSQTSLVRGTASYMSPEQAAGESLGPPSDLYSLGVVLYEALTGRLPFEAESPVAVAFKQVYEEPVALAGIEPSVSGGMNALVMRLLAKSPGDRYGSAAEVSEELRRVRDGEAPETPQYVPPPPVSPPGDSGLPTSGGTPRRRQGFPFLLLGVAVALVLVALAVSLGLYELRPPGAGQVEVPDLVGMKLPEARGALDKAGLTLGSVTRSQASNAPRGEIVSQSPAAGSSAGSGDAVDLKVSSGGGGSGGGSGGGGSGDPGGGAGSPGGGSGGAGDQYTGS